MTQLLRLNAKELRETASKAGISERAAKQLLGSLRINAAKEGGDGSGEKNYEIGLRLLNTTVGADLTSTVLQKGFCNLLDEYRRVCPAIVLWVARGDFSAEQLPSTIGFDLLIHANRTAGRLRAEFLRKLDKIQRASN